MWKGVRKCKVEGFISGKGLSRRGCIAAGYVLMVDTGYWILDPPTPLFLVYFKFGKQK